MLFALWKRGGGGHAKCIEIDAALPRGRIPFRHAGPEMLTPPNYSEGFAFSIWICSSVKFSMQNLVSKSTWSGTYEIGRILCNTSMISSYRNRLQEHRN
jgi:hypothetical protein